MLVSMKVGRGIATILLALTFGGCRSERIQIPAIDTASSPTRSQQLPSCDGAVAATPYANFAAAFNAGQTGRAAAYFAGQRLFAWWDPSNPPGGAVTSDQLADHLAVLYHVGVRLPATIDAEATDNRPGEGGFVWDDRHGFSGKGSIDCQTAGFTYLIIDGWTKAIAGGALVPSPPG
jgi:hypothetical protein